VGLTRKQRHSACRRAHDQQPDEVPLLEAAARIGMPYQTLRVWIDNGKAQGRVARDHGDPIVLVRLNDEELRRLQRLRRQPAKGRIPPDRWEEHEIRS